MTPAESESVRIHQVREYDPSSLVAPARRVNDAQRVGFADPAVGVGANDAIGLAASIQIETRDLETEVAAADPGE